MSDNAPRISAVSLPALYNIALDNTRYKRIFKKSVAKLVRREAIATGAAYAQLYDGLFINVEKNQLKLNERV